MDHLDPRVDEGDAIGDPRTHARYGKRRLILGVTLATTALACAACSSGTAKTARPHPTTPPPTTTGRRPTTAAAGPHAYAVGKRTETFVDTTRPTPPNGTFAGAPSRSLLTTIYYPATGRPDAPVTADVPADHVGGPFPLILFSHGVTARGILYEGLIRLWVRAG
jgi:hypothetical protein